MEDQKKRAEDYTLEIVNGSTLVSCSVHSYGSDVVVRIPDGITHIAPYGLQNCSGVQRFVLPASLVSIGDCAFLNCTDLKAVYIPDTVKALGKGIFRNCPKLQRAHIPENIKKKATDFTRGLPSYLW